MISFFPFAHEYTILPHCSKWGKDKKIPAHNSFVKVCTWRIKITERSTHYNI